MKQIAICICVLLILTSCRQTGKKIISEDEINVEAKNKLESSTVKSSLPPTDSAKLVNHLDSLPTIKFPYKSEDYNRDFDSINLSEFKEKRLFNIPVKLIPTNIGGGSIDDDLIDSTFNLVEKNYKGAWNLIAKRPEFVVVELSSTDSEGIKLVTLKYDLSVIDAINIAISDPRRHYPWFANRHSTINKNLTIVLQHIYTTSDTPTPEGKEISEEKWHIDKTGHFRKSSYQ
ncbi:MAG: hypothetical protein AAGC65_20825 [Mucilaginibacter sp.]|uniref:hypothetical protein n=1 Tax=Mucilaginibacter sp. TaxID=1882438 RepID=UPI0031A8B4FB